MATGVEIAAALYAIAVKGKLEAEFLSMEFSDSGEYRQAFKINTGVIRFAGRMRAHADIYNDVPYAARVEIRHNVLGRVRDYLSTSPGQAYITSALEEE